HSSVERIIIPDSCILLDYVLEKFRAVVQGLVVYEENMLENMKKTRGLVFSQELLLALLTKGLLREEAYRLVQRNSMKSWQERLDFKTLVEKDAAIMQLLSHDEIEGIFDLSIYQAQVDYIFKRCGLD
ncbi:MAG TPA: adenylosuccinate lyase, partial [Syntrophomonas wolfei]|nr:adenylosuccinate lyase [Syntrophomonas wolfei]